MLPEGMTVPPVTTAPAPTMTSSPSTAPFMTIAPMPISTLSPTVHPCTMAPWPMVTPSPIVIGQPSSACRTALS